MSSIFRYLCNIHARELRASKTLKRGKTWSAKQVLKADAMVNVQFETLNVATQPNPTAAISLIAQEPIREVHQNIVACEGGHSPALGHPKIYINLVLTRLFPFIEALL